MTNPYRQRLERVQAAVKQAGIDLVFLNYGPDFTYISGLLTPMYYDMLKGEGDWISGMIFAPQGDPVLVLHPSYAVRVRELTWIEDVRVLPEDVDPDEYLAGVVAEFQPSGKRIGISKMLWGQSLLALQKAVPDATYVPLTNAFMDRIREVKDPDELALMQRAADITVEAFAATLRQLKPGVTEREVALEIEYQVRRAGGEGCSFYPGIICVGNGSDPERNIYERNTEMVLAPGTSVAFDYGVLYQGYCSDFGRSAFVGEPNAEALDAYRSITQATQAATAAMGAGRITPAQVCDFVAERIGADGWGEYYRYMGLGHSIGLEVHEDPWLRPAFTEPIKRNMVFTLEPKVWKPGVFYVRSEDMVLVGDQRAESMTRFSYEPYIIG